MIIISLSASVFISSKPHLSDRKQTSWFEEPTKESLTIFSLTNGPSIRMSRRARNSYGESTVLISNGCVSGLKQSGQLPVAPLKHYETPGVVDRGIREYAVDVQTLLAAVFHVWLQHRSFYDLHSFSSFLIQSGSVLQGFWRWGMRRDVTKHVFLKKNQGLSEEMVFGMYVYED